MQKMLRKYAALLLVWTLLATLTATPTLSEEAAPDRPAVGQSEATEPVEPTESIKPAEPTPEATTTEAPATPAPESDVPAPTLQPSQAPTIDFSRDASHSVDFVQGFVEVLRQADVYDGTSGGEPVAQIGKGVAYALSRANAGDNDDRLKVAFATEGGVLTGYISARDLRPMSDGQAERYQNDNRDAEFSYSSDGEKPLCALEYEPASGTAGADGASQYEPLSGEAPSFDGLVTHYTFDLNASAASHTDITIDLTPVRGATFVNIAGLAADADYAVTANAVIIKISYLSTLSEGEHPIALSFSAGEPVAVTIDVLDSAPFYRVTPPKSVYNLQPGSAHHTDLTFQVEVRKAVFLGIAGLAVSDYTVSDGKVTVYSTTLDELAIGSHSLTFQFDAGNLSVPLMVYDGVHLGAPSPSSATFDAAAPADISVGLALSGCVLTGIEGLTPGVDYTVGTDAVVLKAVYLSTLTPERHDLIFHLDCGDDIPFALDVVDTAPVAQLTPATATFDRYEGGFGHVDVAVSVGHGAAFTGVQGLTEGADYAVSDGLVTLHASALSAMEAGPHTLFFAFEGPRYVPLVLTVIDSANALCVDGTPVSTGSGAGWSYANNLLSINGNGLTISGGDASASIQVAAAVTSLTLSGLRLDHGNIVLLGNSSNSLSITLKANSAVLGRLSGNEKVTVNGTGSMSVTSAATYAISVYSLTVQGGEITASGIRWGIYLAGDFEMNAGSLRVTCSGSDSYGICAQGGVAIHGGSVRVDVIGASAYGVYTASQSIAIDGGDTQMCVEGSSRGYALYAGQNISIVGNGTYVKAVCNYGVFNQASISVNGQSVSVSGYNCAVYEGSSFRRIKLPSDLTIGGRLLSMYELADEISGAGWSWSWRDTRLTLNGYDGSKIDITGAAELALTGGSTNRVVASNGYAVAAAGLIISGGGSLSASGTASGGERGIGIYVVGGLTINDGTILAEGTGAGGKYGYGIYATSGLTLNGGSVTARGTADDGDSDTAYGVYLSGSANVDIHGGSLTAECVGRNAGYGIYAPSCNVTINGGTLAISASGRKMCYGASVGNIQILGGDVRANCGSDGSLGDALSSFNDVVIRGGTVTATATHTNSTSSYGIYASDDVEVYGGSITAHGGSSGLRSSDEMLISGGSVDALGGRYGLDSYGDMSITNGSIDAEGGYSGVDVWGDLAITDGTLSARGTDGAIIARYHITISGGTVSAIVKGGFSPEGALCSTSGAIGIHGGSVTAICGSAYGPGYGLKASGGVSIDGASTYVRLVGDNGIVTDSTVLTVNGQAVTTSGLRCAIYRNGSLNKVDMPSKLTIGGVTYYPSSLTEGAEGAGWSWDAVANRLVLKGYTGTYIGTDPGDSLTIELADGTQSAINVTSTYAFSVGKLIFVGGGSLTASSSSSINCISAASGVEVCGGTIVVSGYSAIYTSGGGVSISGGSVTATGSLCGINAANGILVSGGSVAASGPSALQTRQGDIQITGGSVQATGSAQGLYAKAGRIAISGGRVTVIATGSGSYSMCAPSGIEIGGASTYARVYGTSSAFNPSAISVNGVIAQTSGWTNAIYRGGVIAASPTPYSLTIGGTTYTPTNGLLSNLSGTGWSWSGDDALLTLNGYDGGAIVANGTLCVRLEPGSVNNVGGVGLSAYQTSVEGAGSLILTGLSMSGAGVSIRDSLLIRTNLYPLSGVSFDGGMAFKGTAPTYTLEQSASVRLPLKLPAGNRYVVPVGMTVAIADGASLEVNGTLENRGTITGTVISGAGNTTPVQRVALSQNTATIYTGQSLSLTAGVEPAYAANHAVTWSSSDESVATVSAAGLIVAHKAGSVTITVSATDGSGAYSTCAVTVKQYVSRITLSRTELSIIPGRSLALTATVSPANDTDPRVNWLSDHPEVASVSAEGVVTSVTPGVAVITATAADGAGATASCTVTVVKPAASVTLNASSLTLGVGRSHPLTATVLPEDAADRSVLWTSSDESVATVSAAGLVEARGVGSAVITAEAADGSGAFATCAVTVKQYVSQITLNRTELSIIPGRSIALTATVSPGDATNPNLNWVSDRPEVATVSASGVVTGVSLGDAIITVTAADGDGATATCAVAVGRPVTSISLNLSTVTLGVGQSVNTLVASVAPADAGDKGLAWLSSNPNIAAVGTDGTVTGVKAGTATITATAADGSGKQASSRVVVVAKGKGVSSITLSPTAATVYEGKTLTMKVAYKPSSPSDKAIQWSSSDIGVAKVSTKGVVTGVSSGNAVITATASSGVTATCAIQVIEVPVSGVKLSKSSVSIYIGSTYSLTATVSPSDAKDKSLTWSSGDDSIVTVDATGRVTACGVGAATVTAASANGKSASSKFTVKPILVTKIALAPAGGTIRILPGEAIGKQIALVPTVSPASATFQALKWTSSNGKVALVDQHGVVTSVGPGTATITAAATDGSHKTTGCQVSVFVCASEIQIAGATEIGAGKTIQLKASVLPANAGNKKVKWSTSDKSILAVSSTGTVSAAKGATGKSAVITATAADGGGTIAQWEITVKPAATGVRLSTGSATLYLDTSPTLPLTAICLPGETSQRIFWSSSSPKVARIDQNGVVTALAPGRTTITAAATDGSGKKATCTVTVKSGG